MGPYARRDGVVREREETLQTSSAFDALCFVDGAG